MAPYSHSALYGATFFHGLKMQFCTVKGMASGMPQLFSNWTAFSF